MGGPVEILGQRASQEFLHLESELAEASGIALRVLRETRKKLREGLDWTHGAGGVVLYSRAGLEAIVAEVTAAPLPPGLLEELANRTLPLPEPDDKSAAPEKTGRVNRFWLNPRLFQVRFADGSTGNVRVKSCENFRIGMEVPVREVAPGLYELTRRAPRQPGRW